MSRTSDATLFNKQRCAPTFEKSPEKSENTAWQFEAEGICILAPAANTKNTHKHTPLT